MPRRRSLAENLLLYVAIPSPLLWAIVILAVSGDVQGALQVACAATAAGILGWYLGATLR